LPYLAIKPLFVTLSKLPMRRGKRKMQNVK